MRQQRQVRVVRGDASRASHGTRPDDHVEGGGLAGAVRAQQAHDLAGGDLERQIAHHLRDL